MTTLSALTSFAEARGTRQALADEAVGLLLGAGFTLVLFLGMARFEHFGSTTPAVEIEDLRLTGIPFEPPPPPPKIEEQPPVAEAALPFAGLEVGASDSPVSIAVVPPDLEALVPTAANSPRAKIQFGVLHAEFKPKADIEIDPRHVFQNTEVDQRPRALVRTVPTIPEDVRAGAPTLRVKLLLLVGRDGKAESARVLESSGNPGFDAIVARTVQNEWMFSPALRRGQKVRVLAEQAFRVTFSGGRSPFDVN